MKYLPTAFSQLAFAWKLYHYGLEGRIDAGALDAEIAFEEEGMFFAVPKAFESADDLMVALHNNLTISFGAAAITLNRVREEIPVPLPDPIDTEDDQCVALIYQIRNAFAHDIAEPTWRINGRYRRRYEFGGLEIDLRDLDGKTFDYKHIDGPDAFYHIKDFFSARFGVI